MYASCKCRARVGTEKKVFEKESVNRAGILQESIHFDAPQETDELGNPAPMPVKDGQSRDRDDDDAGRIRKYRFRKNLSIYGWKMLCGSAESQDKRATNANQDVEAEKTGGYQIECGSRTRPAGSRYTAEDKTRQKIAADAGRIRGRQKKRRETEQKERKPPEGKQMKSRIEQLRRIERRDQWEKIRTKSGRSGFGGRRETFGWSSREQ